MASEHLRDPLDYLYEELPPEAMAEVRKHLAECRECRAEMRTVREAVKTYRQAGRPDVPEGLAARAAARALEAAKPEAAEPVATPSLPAAPPPAAPEPFEASSAYRTLAAVTESLERALREQRSKISQESLDAEYNRIREDVMGELKRKNWRGWFFHPAWTVAASVIFLCTLLIHVSPRMNRTEVLYLPASYHRDGEATRQIRERERLPAAAPVKRDEALLPAAGPPPILREAEAMNERMAPPSVPPAPTAAMEAAAASAPRAAPLPESPVLAAAPAQARPAAPVAAMPERAAKRAQGADPAHETPAGSPAVAGESAFSPSPHPAIPPEDGAPPPPELAQEELEPLAQDAIAALPGSPAERAPVVIDMQGMEPPQVVARPAPINVAERIQSLTALAAMQMANGEFVDAWKSIHMLERYDRDAARNLAEILIEVEKAALAGSETKNEAEPPETAEPTVHAAEPDESAAPAAAPPAADAETGDYAAPVSEPVPDAPGETVLFDGPVGPLPGEAGGEDNEVFAPIIPYSPAEPVSIVPAAPPPDQPVEILEEPPIDPPLSVVRVPASMRPPSPASEEWVGTPAPIPELIPGTVYSGSPAATEAEAVPVRTAPAPVPRVESIIEPLASDNIVSSVAPPAPAVNAATVPPVYTEPPSPQPDNAAPVPLRTPSPRRRPFSTDPYIRGY